MNKAQAWIDDCRKKLELREKLTLRINSETLIEPLNLQMQKTVLQFHSDGSIGTDFSPKLFTKEESIEFAKWVLDIWGIKHG